MTIEQFKTLHRNIRHCFPRTDEVNNLPSETDPTQDIPIRNIELTAAGIPINVKDLKGKMPMSGVPIEQLTSIEKRNNDKFDVLGELQESAKTISRSGATTNFKPILKQKKHEE